MGQVEGLARSKGVGSLSSVQILSEADAEMEFRHTSGLVVAQHLSRKRWITGSRRTFRHHAGLTSVKDG